MTPTTELRSRADVEEALENPALVPPPPPASLRAGPTADLRAAMARFSSGDAHARRRAEVIELAQQVDIAELELTAARRASACLDGARIDAVADLARPVPTMSLLDHLGVAGDTTAVRADLRLMVSVIALGQPSSDQTDAAVLRLIGHFHRHPAGAVTVLSLLYQNHEATSALVTTSIMAMHQHTPRRAAVVRTVRIAAADTRAGGSAVVAGSLVVLDLEAAGLEFGAGPHACPGRQLAESIASGINSAVSASGYVVMPDGVAVDDGGRPTRLLMEPLGRSAPRPIATIDR